jgi:1-deoxy-D-xylulose-5-phosphate synthase
MATPVLYAVKRPGDVKKLTDTQQQALCGELRKEIISTVLKTGGHLASSLGVVELTVALHSVFNLPKDKILWDVGHQCYAHKLLTGRRARFGTLRTKGGLAGFPRPSESDCDSFVAGHASTALSAALGMKAAMELKGDSGEVVAVVGDGALTGGLAYEAINNLGSSGKKVILILNDNEMAISRNRGALATYLADIRNRPAYFEAKRLTRASLDRIPVVGTPAKNAIAQAKGAIKQMLYPMTFFEQLGFVYMGPVDGHDLSRLKAVLRQAKRLNGPVVIHVQTQKGRGYRPAEQEPNAYHGVPPAGDQGRGAGPSFSAVAGETLCRLAEQDSRICAITAAMADGTGLSAFAERFGPEGRFFDVGIAEGHATTFSGGLSAGGALPVFLVYSTFLQRAYDNIIHDLAIAGQHVVIGVDRAGLVGDDGETHQGIFDAAFLSTIPGMTVYSPATLDQLRADFARATRTHSGPVALRYPRGGQPVFAEGYAPEAGQDFYYFGSADAPRLLVSYGRLSAEAALAVSRTPNTALLILGRIAPLPEAALELALSRDMVFFAEEGIKQGGIAQQFGAALLERGFIGRYRIRAIEGFVPQGKVEELLDDLGLTGSHLTDWIAEDTDETTA